MITAQQQQQRQQQQNQQQEEAYKKTRQVMNRSGGGRSPIKSPERKTGVKWLTLPKFVVLLVALFLLLVVQLNGSANIVRVQFPIHVSTDSSTTKEEYNDDNNKRRMRRLQTLGVKLKTTTTRYWIYPDIELVLPQARKEAMKENPKSVYHAGWFRRFEELSQWDVRVLQALENHALRTYNVEEADFLIIPIPFGPAVQYLGGPAVAKAVEFLHNHSIFQQYRHKKRHVCLTFHEYIFQPGRYVQAESMLGMNERAVRQFFADNITSVRWMDSYSERSIVPSFYRDFGGGRNMPSNFPWKTGWSISFIGSASDSALAFQPVDTTKKKNLVAEWGRNRSLNFFYHTRTSSSLSNSTWYRHAPCHVASQLLQNSSVGWDIPAAQWRSEFAQAKYCLHIRGDTPISHAMFRAIRNGCLPVIISDVLPAAYPIFRSLLCDGGEFCNRNWDDFAIMIPEVEFEANPARAMNNAILSLTEEDLLAKLHGLSLVQRMLVIDHPRSLFVQSFVRETLASWEPSYYHFRGGYYEPGWDRSFYSANTSV